MGSGRRCLGCRRIDSKEELIRVVAVGNRAVVDREAVLPGRGAYVHPAGECISASIRRRMWSGALRSPGLDVGELEKLEATASHTDKAEWLMDLS